MMAITEEYTSFKKNGYGVHIHTNTIIGGQDLKHKTWLMSWLMDQNGLR